MARIRVSTTVDEGLLAKAREVHRSDTDAALIDAALAALVERHRQVQIDASYASYDDHPIDTPDEWGDLGTWRERAGAS
ncbi:MAG: type II toxin-antitoxin system VapB family antitoxin [Acidimicrobiia bacterium]